MNIFFLIFLVLATFSASALSETHKLELTCLETFLEGLPRRFVIKKALQTKIITKDDVNQGWAYNMDLGKVGAYLETEITDNKVIVTVKGDHSRISIILPEETIVEGESQMMGGVSAAVYPKMTGYIAHKIYCSLEKISKN